MTNDEKREKGMLFEPSDAELKAQKLIAHKLNIEYNTVPEDETERRDGLIKKLIGQIGDGCFMQGPIYFHYGIHTKIGKAFFANFNFTVQDDASVTIGDYCNFGPNVTIVTPVHPMIATERRTMLDENGTRKDLCYAKPVVIGNDCWFGANVTICGGVTIGDGCVIGAGSVVTENIPDNTFAAGIPCKVIRYITEKDSMKFKPNVLGYYKILEE